jgi:hypothetical protein
VARRWHCNSSSWPSHRLPNCCWPPLAEFVLVKHVSGESRAPSVPSLWLKEPKHIS